MDGMDDVRRKRMKFAFDPYLPTTTFHFDAQLIDKVRDLLSSLLLPDISHAFATDVSVATVHKSHFAVR